MNPIKRWLGISSVLLAIVAETSAITIIVAVSNAPPNIAGMPISISGSARYSSPSLPVKGASTRITIGGAVSNTYTTAEGTYSALLSPVAAGIFTAQVCVSDSSISNCASLVVTVTTPEADQTIDFPAIGNQFTTNLVGLAATASSGLPVSFAVASGPAAIADGTNLTFTGAGSVSIVASQAGDASWNPAPDVTNTFDVELRQLEITTSSLPTGMEMVPYSATLEATGGVPPYGWTAMGLPGGLSCSPSGEISGMPMPGQTGTFDVQFSVLDNVGGTAFKTLQLVSEPVPVPLDITTVSLSNGTVMVPYSATLEATGGVPPYSWTAMGLPGGLSCSPSGEISGMPMPGQTGTFDVQFTVLDSLSGADFQTLQIAVDPAPVEILTDPFSLPTGTEMAPYSATLEATNGVPPYSWSALSVLPDGLTFFPEGVVTGVPTRAGSYDVTIEVHDNAGGSANAPVRFEIQPSSVVIATPFLPAGTEMAPYSAALEATNGVPPFTWVWGGVVIDGLTCSPDGVVTGIPTRAGSYGVLFTVMDSVGRFGNLSLDLVIERSDIGIITSTLPEGMVGVTYSAPLEATNGVPPFTWSMAMGLPPGLNCSPEGVISGIPEQSGNYSVDLTVSDSVSRYGNPRLDITILPCAVPPLAPAPLAATDVSSTGFSAGWEAAVTATNYYLDVATDAAFTALVAGYDNWPVGDVLTCPVTDLDPGQTYFYRVRAENSFGASPNSSTIEVTTLAFSSDRYVSLAGGNVAPYTNWTDAAHRIQDALNAAAAGETVWVSNGVFEGNVSFNGKNVRMASLFAQTGNPADIENTVIRGTGDGSAVSFTNNETSAAALIGFTVSNGYANGTAHPFERGGGILCRYASPRLENLRVIGNRARHVGGGLHFEFSQSTVRNIFASGNVAEGGAGVACYYANPSLVNVSLRNNAATIVGGGITLYHATPVMRNLLVADNTAAEKGGGLFFDASSPVIENLTCVGNSALRGGGLNVSYSSHPRLLNSIVWSNLPQQVEFDTRWYYMALSLDHAVLQGGTAAILTHGLGPVHDQGGVLDSDPLFADGDYRLAPASPGRDSGANQPWMATETDLDGSPRIQAGTVDRGTYEAGSAGISGSIRCTILPPAVRQLGARWRVLEGPHTDWNESDVTLYNLPAGPCTVEFQPVAGWTTPANLQPVIVTGMGAAGTGTYAMSVSDAQTPTIDSVLPANGHVTRSNTLALTIAATDNLGIAKVTVNGRNAISAAPGTWTHDLEGLRGPYNAVIIQAYDVAGNAAAAIVNYARAEDLQFHAIHAGLWRVRNPGPTAFDLRWEAVETSESGTGVVAPNSDFTFTTSLQVLSVNLYVDGNLYASAAASPVPAPAEPWSERALDSDGDGLSNQDEALAATDPFSAASYFHLRPAGTPPGLRKLPPALLDTDHSSFAFEWDTSADNAYSVEISRDVFDWAVVPEFDGLQGTGSPMGYTNDTVDSLFFRLKTWPWGIEP